MKPVEFIKYIDTSIGKQWSEDRIEKSYSEEEARVATVLTRMDVSLGASVVGYNAKLLYSIKNGVWTIAVLLLLNLILGIISQ